MAYEDLNTKFTTTSNTSQTGIYPLVNGLDSIKQGLERLLSTPKVMIHLIGNMVQVYIIYYLKIMLH